MKPGEVYWVASSEVTHPHVVIEETESGEIRMCVISTNLKRVNLPGTVLLEKGEANLPYESVVIVSRMVVVKPSQLGEFIGEVSKERLKQINSGFAFIERLLHRHGTPD